MQEAGCYSTQTRKEMSSSKDFFSDLSDMLSARYPIIYLETYEFDRVYRNLKGIAEQGNYKLFSWNRVDQLRMVDLEGETFTKIGEDLEDPEAMMREIAKRVNEEKANKEKKEDEIFVLEGFHDFIEEIEVKIWLRKFGEELKFTKGKKHIIILSPIRNLPKEIEKLVTVLDLPLPEREELRKTLQQVVEDAKHTLDRGIKDKLIDAALGMTELEADLAYCLAWSKEKLGEESPDIVMQEKEQIIKKSGILEFYRQNESLKNVGGLANLKVWLEKRGMAFSPRARAFHLSEPKGILLLGIPGCGKSLTAKAIASMWNMPLLRLDIGKVFEGLVGSSESNMRLAIKTAEAVAPCILWIDEIEKGLAGTGASGNTDSGVTARVFSSLLTWMQEKKKAVFTVATANGVEHLPPELLRKGRFDAIFFVDLPTEEERIDIFEIHLAKRNQAPKKFPLEKLAKASTGYNGAEIEEAINDALFTAFSENPKEPKLTLKHLMQALDPKESVILAHTMRERIEFLRDWADNRALPAGKKNTEKLPVREEVTLAPQEKRRNRDLSGSMEIHPSEE